ncbi:MAG: hypothetical protein QOH92_2106, partial [Chloroflexota bacterium]|nr:hypothetical protein [Chloroflexota bacterium]
IQALDEIRGSFNFLERELGYGVQLAAMGLQVLAGSGIDLEHAVAQLGGHPIILANSSPGGFAHKFGGRGFEKSLDGVDVTALTPSGFRLHPSCLV